MILSSVASSKPVISVVLATTTAVDVAPLPIVTPIELQATSVTNQTQTASPSLPATEGQTPQGSGSEDDAAQF